MQKVSFILIDEVSFLGADYFHLIHRLLGEANPAHRTAPFCRKSIILLGDIGQLLPVKQTPIFQPSTNIFGNPYKLYQTIDCSLVLKTLYRQDGESSSQAEYRKFLDRLRHRKCAAEDTEYVRSRRAAVLSETEVASFEDALRIFPYRREVEQYNLKTLERKFGKRIVRLRLRNNTYMHLAIGAKVILTQNVPYLVEQGITNSTQGTVVCINVLDDHMEEGDTDITELFAVYIEVEKQEGERTVRQIVPIDPDLCYKRELPLALCYAVTIHKCQGGELDKVVAKLGPVEFTTASDYVLFSRVKSITDIMIIDTFISEERITSPRSSEGIFVDQEHFRLKRLQHPCFKQGNIVNFFNKRSLGLLPRHGNHC